MVFCAYTIYKSKIFYIKQGETERKKEKDKQDNSWVGYVLKYITIEH